MRELTEPMAGQGCGELETGVAAALLGQGLMALGSRDGVLGHEQVGGAQVAWAGTAKPRSALRFLNQHMNCHRGPDLCQISVYHIYCRSKWGYWENKNLRLPRGRIKFLKAPENLEIYCISRELHIKPRTHKEIQTWQCPKLSVPGFICGIKGCRNRHNKQPASEGSAW